MTKFFIAVFVALLTVDFIFSQDSVKTKKVKILPVPAFGYSPETRTYIGAVTLFTFNLYNDTATRASNAKLEFNYTWNKQLILENEWNYFLKGEKWFTRGKIHYSKYPDLYYGIGSNTPDSNKLFFNSNRFFVEVGTLKKIGKKLFTGVIIKYTKHTHVNYDSSTVFYPELTGSSAYGIGYVLLKDTRNSLLTPSKGMYFNFNIGYSFSESNYLETTFDIRHYKTWEDKYTLATRLINDFNFSNPPFYDYAILGGDKYVRGYYYGRYRDNHLTSFQSEFRTPVIWRLGLAVFGGISTIYSPSNNFKFEASKYNYGLGIRFLVDKKDKTNLRLDYGIGQHKNSGFYISFGESF